MQLHIQWHRNKIMHRSNVSFCNYFFNRALLHSAFSGTFYLLLLFNLFCLIILCRLLWKILGNKIKNTKRRRSWLSAVTRELSGLRVWWSVTRCLSSKILAVPKASVVDNPGWSKYALKKCLNLCEDSFEGCKSPEWKC